MRRRMLLAALGYFSAILVVVPTAHAGPPVELMEASGAKFPTKTFVLTLPGRRALQPRDVTLRENGEPVDGLQIVPGDAAGAKTFATVPVIGGGRSMRGAPIAAAMAAARQFAARRPPQQRLGVIFFNRTPALALAPTTDAAKISRVLAAPPPLSKGTRIYDA